MSARERLTSAWGWIRPKTDGRGLIRLFLSGVSRYRWLFGALALFWAAFAVFTHYWYISYQWTPSMPYHWYLVRRSPPPPGAIKRGEIVVWRWWGGMGWPKNAYFVKFVRGLPGDTVARVGRQFFVDGKYVGTAMTYSKVLHKHLVANTPGRVPPGCYYLAAPAPNSLDSRYKATGYVPYNRIVGRAYVID